MTQAANSVMKGMYAGLNLYGGVFVQTPNVLNPNEDYGINGYFESHISGTMGGTFVYGGGFWINVEDNFVDAAGFVCAQDNGIYEATATTLTNAKYIYGMRMESVLTSTPSGGLFPFSTNTNNMLISSIFHCADDGPSIGYTAGGGATPEAGVVGTVKLATLNNGNILYLHVFSTAT